MLYEVIKGSSFSQEMNALETELSLKRDSILLNLSPFYDTETGTIRVGGRLAQGQFGQDKTPKSFHI